MKTRGKGNVNDPSLLLLEADGELVALLVLSQSSGGSGGGAGGGSWTDSMGSVLL